MLKCTSPATGQVIERICSDDRRTVHRSYRRLRRGQPRWSSEGWHGRLDKITAFGRLLGRQAEGGRLFELLSREVGTPRQQVRAELSTARRRVDEFVELGSTVLGDEVVRSRRAGREFLEHRPLGVVAHISTWSFPCLVGVEAMVPALLAGNSVLYKPSEYASLTGRALVELMWEAGIPEDVVDVVVGGGSVGDYVLDEAVSGVFFAGEYSTGQMIDQKLAGRMIPRRLEVGAKDGVYVCDDVDVAAVARDVADAAFYNSGRSRRSFDRVYVRDRIRRPFVDALCRRVESYDVGDPDRDATFVGPVIGPRYLDELEYQIADAVQKGGRLMTGGRVRGGQGCFFEPTIVADADHRMLVMREETRGPILAVEPVDDDAEAATRLQDSDYPLTAGIYTGDRDRAQDMLDGLDAVDVYWRGDLEETDDEPGIRNQPSGIWRPLCAEGIRHFTRPKSWAITPG